MIGDMGSCALCISSAGGRLTTDQTFSRLVILAPSLAAGAGAIRRDYDEWLQMPDRIRSWLIEANGHEPSGSDVGLYVFQWREQRARPEEFRRRIFSAAKEPLPKS